MVSIDEAVLARYSKSGRHFEVYVDPVKALEVKHGKDLDMTEVLAVQEIFKDARKGDRVAETSLAEVFGTDNVLEAAKQIIREGDLQLTTDQRKEMVEQRKKAVVDAIAREAFNPQTKTPHPAARIEKAIEESRVSIDPFEKKEVQIEKVLKAIRPILPISMERLRIEVVIPAEFTGKIYGTLRKYALEKEEWLPDGRLKAIIKIPAGLEDALYDAINDVCKGSAECKRLAHN
jgi:ribosome maturation protein SDO1